MYNPDVDKKSEPKLRSGFWKTNKAEADDVRYQTHLPLIAARYGWLFRLRSNPNSDPGQIG